MDLFGWRFIRDVGTTPEEVRQFHHDLEALEKRLRKLETEETARNVEWLTTLQKLDKLARRLVRAERNQDDAPTSDPPPARGRRTPIPPTNLRGARLRIWLREHGLTRDPDEVEIGQPGASVNGEEA